MKESVKGLIVAVNLDEIGEGARKKFWTRYPFLTTARTCKVKV